MKWMAFAAVILGDGQQYYRRVGKVKPVHRYTADDAADADAY